MKVGQLWQVMLHAVMVIRAHTRLKSVMTGPRLCSDVCLGLASLGGRGHCWTGLWSSGRVFIGFWVRHCTCRLHVLGSPFLLGTADLDSPGATGQPW